MGSLTLPIQSPDGPLYRVGRKPDAWLPPDWAYVGDDGTFGNRFDVLEGRVRVLYAASSPLACFVETLARYRLPPNLEDLRSALASIENAPNERIPFGRVPISWLNNRVLGKAVSERKAFADVYCAEWLSYLRRNLEPGLMGRRLYASQDFDLAFIASQDRRLTQHIATLAYHLGFSGIYYQSRHGSNLSNWALFEPFELHSVTSVLIDPANPELGNALRLLNIALDPAI